MKKVVRVGTFETVSSNMCCLVCFNDEEWEKWKSGNYYIRQWEHDTFPKLYTKDEAEKMEESLDEDYCDFVNTNDWQEYLEHDVYEIKDSAGNNIHIEVAYGNDY